MKFIKGDLVILNDYGIKMLFTKNSKNNKRMNTTLFRVASRINEQEIYIERMNGGEITNSLSVDFYRPATQFQIKLFTIKEIFS